MSSDTDLLEAEKLNPDHDWVQHPPKTGWYSSEGLNIRDDAIHFLHYLPYVLS